MAYNRAEWQVLTLLFLVIVLLWGLFGFFWSILLVFSFLVLAYSSSDRGKYNRGKRGTIRIVDETLDHEKEDFDLESVDVPFKDIVFTKRLEFTLKSPRPLLSEVTRTLNYNVSRRASPIKHSFSKRNQSSEAFRRRFGDGANELSWKQSKCTIPTLSQPSSPNYFSVLNRPATVKIASPDFVNRSFVNMENAGVSWMQRNHNPCSRDTVLSALSGARKRSVLEEDEDTESLKIRKKSRYNNYYENDAPVQASTSNVDRVQNTGVKRATRSKASAEDVEIEHDNARKKRRNNQEEDESPEGTSSSDGERRREKRSRSVSTAEQLKRAPVQHSTPVVSSENERSEVIHSTRSKEPLRALPIKDSDVVMVDTCEAATKLVEAKKTKETTLVTSAKQRNLPETEQPDLPKTEDKSEKEKSHKKQASVVRKDDPRRRAVPVYCASAEGVDLPPRRQATHRINHAHFKQDRQAAWERVKRLLDDDEEEEEEGKETKTASTDQSQKSQQGVPSTVSLPVTGLGSAASSAEAAVQPPPGTVTQAASASTVCGVAVNTALTVSSGSVTSVSTTSEAKSVVKVNCTGQLSSTAVLSTGLPFSFGTTGSETQANPLAPVLPIRVGKAVTTTTQSLTGPVVSVPQMTQNSSGVTVASQGALGTSSTPAQPITFGLTQTTVASSVSVPSTSSNGFSFVKTTPSGTLGSSVVQSTFNFGPSASSTPVNPAPPATLGTGLTGNFAFTAPAASTQNPLGQNNVTNQTTVGINTTGGQTAFGSSANPAQGTLASTTNAAQNAFGSTFNAAQNASVSGANSAQNTLGSGPNPAQNAFGSTFKSTQNTLGSGPNPAQNAFGSTFNSTQNTLGAVHNPAQNAFGSTVKSTQNTPGSSTTQSALAANSNSVSNATQNAIGFTSTTQNAFGGSSNSTQGAFGSGTSQSAIGFGCNPVQSAFGASSNTSQSVFGSKVNASQNPFGSAPNAFGSNSKSTFGTSLNTTQNAFGSAATASPKAFGAVPVATQNAFGSAATASPKAFGAVPVATQNAFGSAATGSPKAFGAVPVATQNAFGSAATGSPKAFGAVPVATQNAFGSAATASPKAFGAAPVATQNAFGSGQAQNAFGTSSTKPNFPQSAFGANHINQNAFGVNSNSQNKLTFASGSNNQTSVSQNTFASSSSQHLTGGQPSTNSPFKFSSQVQTSSFPQANTGLTGGQVSTNPPFKFGGQAQTSSLTGGQAASNSPFNFASQGQSGFGSGPQSSIQSPFGSGASQNTSGSAGGFNFSEAAKQSNSGYDFSSNVNTTGGLQFGSGSRPATPVPSGGFNFGAGSGSGRPGSPFAQSTSAAPSSVAAQRQRARLTARRRGKK